MKMKEKSAVLRDVWTTVKTSVNAHDLKAHLCTHGPWASARLSPAVCTATFWPGTGGAGQEEGRGNTAEVAAKQEERQMLAAASLEETTKLIRTQARSVGRM